MLFWLLACVDDKITVDGSTLLGGAWSTSIAITDTNWSCGTTSPGDWTGSMSEGVCTLRDPEAAGFAGLATYATLESTGTTVTTDAPIPDYVTWWSESYLDDFGADAVWWNAHAVSADAARSSSAWSYTFDVIAETGNPEAVYLIYPDLSLAFSDADASFWTSGDGYADVALTVGFTGGGEEAVYGAAESRCSGGSSGEGVYRLAPYTWIGTGGRGPVEMVPILVSGTQKPSDAFVTRITPSSLGDLRTLWVAPAGSTFVWSGTTLSTSGLTSLTRGRASRFSSGTQLGMRYATSTLLTSGRSYTFPTVTVAWSCPRRSTARPVPQAPGYTLALRDLGVAVDQNLVLRPLWAAGGVWVEPEGLPTTGAWLACLEGPGAVCTVDAAGFGYATTAELTLDGVDLSVALDPVYAAGVKVADALTLTLGAR